MTEINDVNLKAGKYSSLAAGICTVIFGLLIILDFAVKIAMAQFLVCFLLAISFVILANSLYAVADPKKKLWGRIAVSFAVMYAVYICLVYYSQMTVIQLGAVPKDSLPLIEYAPGSWLFAIDMLGYAFLALSTLAAAFLFTKKGLEKKIKVLLIIHGALAIPTAVFPALPLFSGASAVESASIGGSLALLVWCAIFAPACFMLTRYFSFGSKAQNSATV